VDRSRDDAEVRGSLARWAEVTEMWRRVGKSHDGDVEARWVRALATWGRGDSEAAVIWKCARSGRQLDGKCFSTLITGRFLEKWQTILVTPASVGVVSLNGAWLVGWLSPNFTGLVQVMNSSDSAYVEYRLDVYIYIHQVYTQHMLSHYWSCAQGALEGGRVDQSRMKSPCACRGQWHAGNKLLQQINYDFRILKQINCSKKPYIMRI
jgi:hypothetical protein